MNKAILLGNLGKDPEIRVAGSTKVAICSLATTKSWKDKSGEWQNQTEWHNLEVWGKAAEYFADKAKKGNQVLIEGEISYKKWEKEGVERIQTSIKVQTFKILTQSETKSGGDDLPF